MRAGASATRTPFNAHVLDWDGDGLGDLAYAGTGVLKVVRNEGFNPAQPGATLAEPQRFIFDLDSEHFPRTPGPSFTGVRVFDFANADVIDVNGDGRADLVMAVREEFIDCRGATCPRPADDDDASTANSNLKTQGRYILFEMRFNELTGEYRLGSTEVLASTEDDETEGGFPKARDLELTDLNADGLVDALYFNPSSPSTERWELRLNRGGSFGLAQWITHWPTEDKITRHMQLTDINGDGHPDALFPSAASSGSAVWQVSYWDWSRTDSGAGHFAPLVSTAAAAGNVGRGASSLLADFNGSAKTDQLLIVPNSSGDLKYLFGPGVRSGGGITSPAFVLRRITDGYGAWTELAFKPLTDPAVYRRGTSGASRTAAGSVVYDVIPPIHVVSSATSLSPQYVLNGNATGSTFQSTGTTRVEYFYSEARIAGGGRGFLGFREVASFDPQSGMLTRTRYQQEFPFIGLPEATRSWFLNGNPWPSTGAPKFPNWIENSCAGFSSASWNTSGKIFLGCSRNTWAERATIAGLVHPYLAGSEEWSFNPTYASTGVMDGSEFTRRVVTENGVIDDYGNVEHVAVSTYTSQSGTTNRVARQTTTNAYANDSSSWHLGRLECSTVTSARPGEDPVTRISTFAYDSATGILTRETVNAASCADATGSLKTVYALDDFGNRETTTVTGDDIGPEIDQERRTKSLYDSQGRFVDTEQVWLNGAWRTTRNVLARDRYGNATKVRDAQGVIAIADFDLMGRPHYSYTPDGAWTRTLHGSGGHSYCPSGTVSREERTASDGSRSWICKDTLGRETRTIVWGFNGERINTDTHYDYAARPVEISEPYFSGRTAFWTRTTYDEIGRVEFVRLPDGNTEGFSYTRVGSGTSLGISTVHTNARGKLHRTDRNALGEKINEIAADGGKTTYGYDALGQLTSTDGPLDRDTIVIEYDGRGHKKRMVDPDKGTWTYRHNALGELVCQKDANGQLTEVVYDELGRWTLRRDMTGTGSVSACDGTVFGTTTWRYGNIAQTPNFGQLTHESSQYSDGRAANHTTMRDYRYDGLGRLKQVDTTIAEAGGFNRNYTERTTYDQFGRVFQSFDAAGGDRGTRFVYNPHGYLRQLKEARQGRNGQVYWEVLDQDPRGQVTRAVIGNGMEVDAHYDPATGRLEHKVDGNGNLLVQNLELFWDEVGNLKRRHDRGGMRNQLEGFTYDDRDRLEEVLQRIDGATMQTVQLLRYDRSGNIVCKSDLAGSDCSSPGGRNYRYTGARPHAVTEAGERSFDYDANGNVIRDYERGLLDREFHYTTYDKIRRIERDGKQVEFHYGADRARTLKRELDQGTVTRRTHYVGSVEVVYRGPDPDSGEFRRYIGGVAIATFFEATGIDRTRYLHTDHLGSTTAITDEVGQIVAQMGFDAWGKRRDGNDWATVWQQWAMGITPVWALAVLDITPRGYTGHEHADAMGVIHMNGRIYDPQLGRFLQADPFVEDATTLNRYTYVYNNPLSLTDPSGFFSFKKFFRTAVSVAVSVTAGILTAGASTALQGFLFATLGGALAGRIATTSIEGALWGAFSGAAFFGIGQGFEQLAGAEGTGLFGTGLSKGEFALQSISHGMAGGTIAEMQGGKFGHGFLSAGISKAATPGVAANVQGIYRQGFVLAIVGGTTSEISGGKFANGAVTAAMGFAFNQVATGLSKELARGLKVKSLLKQVEDLTPEDLEALFGRRFTADDALIFKEHIRTQTLADFFSDTSSLKRAALDIVESEYKSAGFGPARGLTRRAIITAISKKLSVPEQFINQTLRAERVIQEVDSIEPTLKAVAEGIRQGNEEVLHVLDGN
ncbi:MAG: RHS repeat-associated core domain-containing protein [Wenzhouxiangellaceae bacterium]|nr:RHS repeat-associated core domain-containing protein [Wenzhouxiangellaceae bacterium]